MRRAVLTVRVFSLKPNDIVPKALGLGFLLSLGFNFDKGALKFNVLKIKFRAGGLTLTSRSEQVIYYDNSYNDLDLPK